jgi:ribosomal protein L11 methyltransferase
LLGQPATFIKLSILNVRSELEDAISSLCFDNEALGVSENLDFDKKVYPEPKIIQKSHKNLEAYFYETPSDLIGILQSRYPEIEVVVETQENKDWMEEWKKGFHAFKLYDRFWIVPSWEKAPENIEAIYIDPGMAFGTGTHETTQICSELIFKCLESENPKSLIDVGTGTGILAFVAHKMGVPIVMGTDNDPEAVRVANENAAINKVDMRLTDKDLNMIPEKFDVVVANIIDGVLLKLKELLLQKRNPNGSFILSGIIIENDAEFIAGFLKDTDLQVIERIQKGEWVGYLLR